jgi:hypothetical protein
LRSKLSIGTFDEVVVSKKLKGQTKLTSSARRCPISFMRSTSQVAPKLTPLGKKAAGIPSPKTSPLAPEGPSDT